MYRCKVAVYILRRDLVICGTEFMSASCFTQRSVRGAIQSYSYGTTLLMCTPGPS